MLKPVRGRMVRRPDDWLWSSYRASVGLAEPPQWLDVDWVLAQLAQTGAAAVERFRPFVEAGRGQPAPWEALRNPVFLGSQAFVERMQACIGELDGHLREVATSQRRKPAATLEHYWRDDAIALAYASGGYAMQGIGGFFGLHDS